MSEDELKEIPVVFYRTAAGAEPVRDWLRGLSAEDRKTIGADLATVQVGWPIGMPLCGSLGGGLWEVRSKLANKRIARLLFFIADDRIGVWCTASSRRRRRPRPPILIWRKSA